METRTYKVYKFNEASPELKAKILERYRDINTDHEWWNAMYSHYISDRLEPMGYDDIKINFSGFYSQGDGASFTALIDTARYIKTHKLQKEFPLIYKYPETCRISLERITHHYSHKMTVKTSSSCYGNSAFPQNKNDRLENEVDALEKLIERERINLCHDLYGDLEKDYDGLREDEAIIDTLEANEYDFDEDGKID